MAQTVSERAGAEDRVFLAAVLGGRLRPFTPQGSCCKWVFFNFEGRCPAASSNTSRHGGTEEPFSAVTRQLRECGR